MSEPVQYLLPDGFGLEALREGLGDLVEPSGSRATTSRTFYDTFDGRLHEAGVPLVHEAGRLALGEDAVEARQAPRRVMVSELPPGRLRDRLDDLIEMRAALPVARVRSRLQTLRVLDGERKTVVRAIVEEPTLHGGAPLPARLHLAGVRGYDKALARVQRDLEDRLGLERAPRPLVDEAVARSGGVPGGVSSKLEIELRPHEPADRAASGILARLVSVIEANLPGTLDDVDTEFLHDLRVAVRRTRSMQRELKEVFPPDRLDHHRAEFKWLQQVTGPTRDLDVYLLDFDDFRAAVPDAVRPDLDPLHDLLARRRETERRAMTRALRSERARSALSGWAGLVEELGRDGSARPVEDVASERIAKVFRQMVKMGRAIGDDTPHEALHDLRKKGKELRYLLEFFSSLYPSDVVKPMVKTLKALQDTLGRFQDREVQAEMLRSLRDEVAAVERGPAALMAMGTLVERLEGQQASARAEFGERFAAFSSKAQRDLVDRTFR